MNDNGSRTTLRDLSLPARLTLSVFLVSVGVGYISALVQLHFQHASGGAFLPSPDDAVEIYNGTKKMSKLERLITASELLPFNGSGSMRPAFFRRSLDWSRQIKKLTKEKKISEEAAIELLRRERKLEIKALLTWLREGAKEAEYDNGQPLPDDFFKGWDRDPNGEFFVQGANGKWQASINAILEVRCARCHAEGKGGAAGSIHLDVYENVSDYTQPERGDGMALPKLAQTSHVHLLGFSMLYGLTGLILAFSSYPTALKIILCPMPLVAQVIDISCWWLGRIDPFFARCIVLTGGAVATSLVLQIGLSLWDMYRWSGRTMLVALALAAGGGGYVVWDRYISPHLAAEKARSAEKFD